MKSRKIKTALSAGVVLLFTAGFLSGCGSEPEETSPESKEITTEPIQDVETIIDPATSIDDAEETETYGENFGYDGLDDQEGLETKKESMEGILDELSDTASDTVDATEEAVTETTDAIRETAKDKVASIEDTIADVQEDATTKLESVKEEPTTTMAEDAEEIVAPTPDLMRRVQQALANEGYNPGPVDGIRGPRTLAALKSFQEDNDLAAGELTKETLRALNVNF